MIKNRHYRGGYQFAGLLEIARDLRNTQTVPKFCCGKCFVVDGYWALSSEDSINWVTT